MKTTVISIIAAVLLIGGAAALTRGGNVSGDGEPATHNVSVEGGRQVIEIDAKGGYSPKLTDAQAGMPTVLKVATNGTFDCSAALTIPSLGYSRNLPSSGVTEIEVPSQKAGAKLQGLCAMGMYNFAVQFN